MAISRVEGKNIDIELWTPVNEVESGAIDQLRKVYSQISNSYEKCCNQKDLVEIVATLKQVMCIKG